MFISNCQISFYHNRNIQTQGLRPISAKLFFAPEGLMNIERPTSNNECKTKTKVRI